MKFFLSEEKNGHNKPQRWIRVSHKEALDSFDEDQFEFCGFLALSWLLQNTNIFEGIGFHR